MAGSGRCFIAWIAEVAALGHFLDVPKTIQVRRGSILNENSFVHSALDESKDQQGRGLSSDWSCVRIFYGHFYGKPFFSEPPIPFRPGPSPVREPFPEIGARFLLDIPDDCAIDEGTAVFFSGNTVDEIHGALRE